MREIIKGHAEGIPASTAEISALKSRVLQCERLIGHFAQVECELKNQIAAMQKQIDKQTAK